MQKKKKLKLCALLYVFKKYADTYSKQLSIGRYKLHFKYFSKLFETKNFYYSRINCFIKYFFYE